MKRPNFFIIGAPKCGTTALSQYLDQHPRVFICPIKEPHYFNTDFLYRTTTTIDAYLTHFEQANDTHFAVGEASTHYLYSSIATENILNFEPDAKFIVMVRNPIDMAPALHAEELFQFLEDITDFEKAWQLQESRRWGRNLSKFHVDWRFLMYGDRCLIGQQLKRVYQLVSRDKVKVIVFDDFISDTRSIYESTLQFLGVSSDHRRFFPKVNERKQVRLVFLDRALKHALRMKRAMRIGFGLGLIDPIRKVFYRKAPQTKMRESMKTELRNFFKDDILELSFLIGRDLSHWLQE